MYLIFIYLFEMPSKMREITIGVFIMSFFVASLIPQKSKAEEVSSESLPKASQDGVAPVTDSTGAAAKPGNVQPQIWPQLPSDSSTVNESKNVYKNPDGTTTEFINKTETSADGRVVETTTTEITKDKDGTPLSKTENIVKIDGKQETTTKTETDYNEKGIKISETTTHPDGSDTWTRYDKDGKITQRIDHGKDGKSTGHARFDEEGNVIEMDGYAVDKDGNILDSKNRVVKSGDERKKKDKKQVSQVVDEKGRNCGQVAAILQGVNGSTMAVRYSNPPKFIDIASTRVIVFDLDSGQVVATGGFQPSDKVPVDVAMAISSGNTYVCPLSLPHTGTFTVAVTTSAPPTDSEGGPTATQPFNGATGSAAVQVATVIRNSDGGILMTPPLGGGVPGVLSSDFGKDISGGSNAGGGNTFNPGALATFNDVTAAHTKDRKIDKLVFDDSPRGGVPSEVDVGGLFDSPGAQITPQDPDVDDDDTDIPRTPTGGGNSYGTPDGLAPDPPLPGLLDSPGAGSGPSAMTGGGTYDGSAMSPGGTYVGGNIGGRVGGGLGGPLPKDPTEAFIDEPEPNRPGSGSSHGPGPISDDPLPVLPGLIDPDDLRDIDGNRLGVSRIPPATFPGGAIGAFFNPRGNALINLGTGNYSLDSVVTGAGGDTPSNIGAIGCGTGIVDPGCIDTDDDETEIDL